MSAKSRLWNIQLSPLKTRPTENVFHWARELPIEGQRRDVVEILDAYARGLSKSSIPKLFIDGDPGGFLIGAQREFCRAWPNQQTVTVKGAHFLQEDAPVEVGEAMARFVAKVLAGQIS